MLIPPSRRLDFSEIPVIDLAGLCAGRDDPAAISALGRACADIGFLYVCNHGVHPDLVAGLAAAAARFFARPMDEKLSIVVNGQMRGYLPLGYRSYEGEPGAATSHQEGFWIGQERPVSTHYPFDGPNQWLASVPELQPAMLAYFAAVQQLSLVLQRGFALALGLAADFFTPFFAQPLSRLKLNHYPPQDAPSDDRDIGVVPHSDSGAFTILWQDDNGGLEIQSKSGDWVGAPPIPGTFVINIGNLTQIWTNGRFSSTPHRVINRAGTDRYSIPLFVNPSYDVQITPLIGETDPAFVPFRYGDYQRASWRRSFPVARIAA
jgi:isopenicillin N synthase-like dioxygenase